MEDFGQTFQNKSWDIVNAMRVVFLTKVRLDGMMADKTFLTELLSYV
jgi:hypothetical protein